MPFWQVFVPENAFTDEDKEALAESITSMYTDFVNLPKFYVVVQFHANPENSLYVGGKPANNFVRILVDHGRSCRFPRHRTRSRSTGPAVPGQFHMEQFPAGSRG